MDKQKTIRLALWVVIGIILLLLLRWCEGTGLLGHFKPNTDTLIVHKRDTIRDTVSIVKMKTKRVFDYVEIPVHDTTFKFDSTACFVEIDSGWNSQKIPPNQRVRPHFLCLQRFQDNLPH